MKGRMEMDGDAFERLRAELRAIEPSAAFAAGVRARVAAESAPRVKLIWLGMAATATFGVAVAVWSWGTATTAPVIPAAAPAVASAPDLPVPTVSPAPPIEPVRVTRAVRRAPRVAAAVAPAESRLEVLVPPDEAIAIRQLLLSQRRGHGVVPPVSAMQVTIEKLPEIRALEIAPIQIPRLSGEGKDK